jgi:hypothetical protein
VKIRHWIGLLASSCLVLFTLRHYLNKPESIDQASAASGQDDSVIAAEVVPHERHVDIQEKNDSRPENDITRITFEGQATGDQEIRELLSDKIIIDGKVVDSTNQNDKQDDK